MICFLMGVVDTLDLLGVAALEAFLLGVVLGVDLAEARLEGV